MSSSPDSQTINTNDEQSPPEERSTQGELNRLRTALQTVHQLAGELESLHKMGRLHLAIDQQHLQPNSSGTLALTDPTRSRTFGGFASKSKNLPHQFNTKSEIVIPTSIAEAKSVLSAVGIKVDPRAIDIYQLAGLFLELLTGSSVESYLRSPRTKMLVPSEVHHLLDRIFACEASDCISDVATFRDLFTAAELSDRSTLERAGEELASEHDTSPTLLGGVSHSETPVSGVKRKSPKPDADLPFATLGHFQIIRRLGHGGMGDVYLAYEPELNREVAIKVLPPEFARDPDFVRRFRAEASAVAKLTHPNIVQVHAIGEDNGKHFFAMQHIEGPTLSELLAETQCVTPSQVIAIIRQVLAGIATAHAHGLVHRDIKPANVLMDNATGRSLLADFGLVKQIQETDRNTATGVVMGTVDYLSPEQGRGKPVDGRSDLYSIGVLMYRMLAGRLPFAAESPTAMIFQHAYEQPQPLRELAPETPLALVDVVERLLAKSPDDRFQTAEETLVALNAISDRDAPISPPVIRSSTQVIRALSAEELPNEPDFVRSMPSQLPRNGWARLMTRVLSWFQESSPRLANELLGTQLQCDAAVGKYALRHESICKLVTEAESVILALDVEAKRNRNASEDAGRRADRADNEDVADVLRAEQTGLAKTALELHEIREAQQQQLVELRIQAAKIGSRLAQLRSQQAMFATRMKVAQSEIGKHSTLATGRISRPKAIGVGCVGIALVLLVTQLPRMNAEPRVLGPMLGPVTAVANQLPTVSIPFTAAQATSLQKNWATRLRRNAIVTNSIGMKLALIPPGEFDIAPNCHVKITKPFDYGVHEVTNAQFARFVDDTNYTTTVEAIGNGLAHLPVTDAKKVSSEYTWKNRLISPGDHYPVVLISRVDALAFLEWLSQKEGQTYRLPTEAEWEWATRAGSNEKFYFGAITNRDKSMWHKGNSGMKLHPVGQKSANPWSLTDMHGNAIEMLNDYHSPYQNGTVVDPRGAESGKVRSLRGGSFRDGLSATSFRFTVTGDTFGCYNIGLRVVREISVATNSN